MSTSLLGLASSQAVSCSLKKMHQMPREIAALSAAVRCCQGGSVLQPADPRTAWTICEGDHTLSWVNCCYSDTNTPMHEMG